MPFTFRRLDAIPDVVLVEPRLFADERGAFMETYKQSEFAKSGIPDALHQDNCSISKRGVLRGLHYQLPPAAQGKLVRCLKGEVYDVAVDIRVGSPTFGRWADARLSAENRHMLWVPVGFAHGFQSLTDGAEVMYKTTHEYSPPHERCIRWDDPALAIPWPIAKPILHQKDAQAPLLADAENKFRWSL
ncbi:MAG: dTDP-4-dehydrorhamnose 3,5-epimerase [Thermoplasmatota archaeon]